MLKKLLVALVASAFALGAYAQAPKAEPKADTKTEAKKDGEIDQVDQVDQEDQVDQGKKRRRESQGRAQGTQKRHQVARASGAPGSRPGFFLR